jgi:4-carboxymuconolactone decarboxylase
MARLPIATRASVPENQRSAFDEMVGASGSAPKYGPGSVLAHVPELSKRNTALNQYLRNESSLPKKIQELAMLVTAREMDCQHIWNAHAGSARQAGVPDGLVDSLREYDDLEDLAPDEEAVVNYARAILRTHYASRGAYQAALEQFGTQGLIELTMLIGTYASLALAVNAFDTDLLPERTEPLLPVD